MTNVLQEFKQAVGEAIAEFDKSFDIYKSRVVRAEQEYYEGLVALENEKAAKSRIENDDVVGM